MTMTPKQRFRAAFRGEMPDLLPYVPRIDLWYNANSYAATLPEKHRGRTPEPAEAVAVSGQIAAFYRMVTRPGANRVDAESGARKRRAAFFGFRVGQVHGAGRIRPRKHPRWQNGFSASRRMHYPTRFTELESDG